MTSRCPPTPSGSPTASSSSRSAWCSSRWAWSSTGWALAAPSAPSPCSRWRASLLHAATTTATALVVARAVIGLGCAGSFMGAVVLCHRWYGGARFTTALSWIFALSNLGTLAAATPLAAVTEHVGWRWAFVYATGVTVLVGVLFHLLVRDAPPGRTEAAPTAERLGAILRGLAQVWRSPGLPRVLAIHTFAYASMITVLGLVGRALPPRRPRHGRHHARQRAARDGAGAARGHPRVWAARPDLQLAQARGAGGRASAPS